MSKRVYETSDARLDRLNWQSRRRQWDSALAPQPSAVQDPQGSAELPVPMVPLKERFTELEYRVERLTREMGRFQADQQRLRHQRWLVSLLVLVLVGSLWALGTYGLGRVPWSSPLNPATVRP